jgi:hypothetical protein
MRPQLNRGWIYASLLIVEISQNFFLEFTRPRNEGRSHSMSRKIVLPLQNLPPWTRKFSSETFLTQRRLCSHIFNKGCPFWTLSKHETIKSSFLLFSCENLQLSRWNPIRVYFLHSHESSKSWKNFLLSYLHACWKCLVK